MSKLEAVSKYWTSGADGYDKVIHTQFRSRREVAFWQKRLSEGLGERTAQRVLDVGTGPGFFSILLSRMGHRPEAVDASPGMVERAKRNFAEFGFPEIPVNLADASDLRAIPADSFDAVVCRDVVWTLPDPHRAYAEWLRVLKPGGRLIVFDGNYLYEEDRSLGMKLRYGVSWLLILATERRMRRRESRKVGVLDDLPFVQVRRPDADKEALAQAGFEPPSVRTDHMSARELPLHHLKYGFLNGTRFMIVAGKPERSEKTEG
ncbi:methyltransferase domain-containing protein [Saccharibacillus sp. CPCC 101409]|uniref:class I SAM-dependent methyltransferase n=1 Tax=Saccharibacillus sp. CPCC 101409 TaxID=3058041 RepID=UPI0026727EF4|nr:class I SAM-dependent methyltransferase [Saccharibacillus sp. CPCC 101409]MDO3410327.1 methyltransferase domain-containing protein [Saccharibacillus sp. CPCC 101409]